MYCFSYSTIATSNGLIQLPLNDMTLPDVRKLTIIDWSWTLLTEIKNSMLGEDDSFIGEELVILLNVTIELKTKI